MKTDVNVPYLQQVISKNTLKKNIFFVGFLSAAYEKSRIRIRNSVIWIPRIRIRTKTSRIHNTGSELLGI